ncbi:MAG: hypothetical protein ACLP5V_00920 [Candidatus Bathyarchaeia archaeon]
MTSNLSLTNRILIALPLRGFSVREGMVSAILPSIQWAELQIPSKLAQVSTHGLMHGAKQLLLVGD